MSAHRMDMHRLQEMVRLHRAGTKTREVARLLGMSRNTEREYRLALVRAGLLDGPQDALPELALLKAAVVPATTSAPAHEASTVAAWSEQVGAMLKVGAGPTAIFDALRLKHGAAFKGSLSAIKRLCARLTAAAGPRAEDVVIPVETVAGEVAQVDFGYVGLIYDPQAGVLRKTWAFVLVLGFSRHMVVRLVFDQSATTWVRLHIEAFQELGGVPKVVVPDNLKAAVIRAAFGTERDGAGLNRTYRELARHYDFKVDPTPPRAPEKKGKVESAVKYVKRNFFAPRKSEDLGQLLVELPAWVATIAGGRRHGATHQQPLETFIAEERPLLKALPSSPYEMITWTPVKVHTDCHVQFDGRLYSVPWERMSAKSVWVKATPTSVLVYADDARVATHARQGPGRRSTVDAHLPEHRRDLRHRSRDFWEARADRIGIDVGAYVREVFDRDQVLLMLRPVQAIVVHLERFPPHRANAACRRASHFGNYAYAGIKEILRKALDLEPYGEAAAPVEHGRLETPRFARPINEMLATHVEVMQ